MNHSPLGRGPRPTICCTPIKLKALAVPHQDNVEKKQQQQQPKKPHILDVCVGADDVLNLIRVWILEGEAAGSDQHPLAILHPETIHN